MGELFSAIARHTLEDQSGVPLDDKSARSVFMALYRERACMTAVEKIWQEAASEPDKKLGLAYLVSWLQVAGGNSVMPAWVRHRFKGIRDQVRL